MFSDEPKSEPHAGLHVYSGGNGLAVKTLRCGGNGSKDTKNMLGDGNETI